MRIAVSTSRQFRPLDLRGANAGARAGPEAPPPGDSARSLRQVAAQPVARKPVQQAKSKPVKYLDFLPKFASKGNPTVAELKQRAYLLSLPTSSQFRMISRAAGGSLSRTDAKIAAALDRDNQLVYFYNAFSHGGASDADGLAVGKKMQAEVQHYNKKVASHARAMQEHRGLQSRLDTVGKKILECGAKLSKKELRNLRAEKKELESFLRKSEESLRSSREKIDAAAGRIKDKLKDAINENRRSLDAALKKAAAKPGSGRVGAYQVLRASLCDTETLSGVRTDWRYWEMLGVSPAEFDDVAENPDLIKDWLKQGFSAKEALSFKNAGYEIDQVAHLRGSGIPGPLVKEIERFGYTKDWFKDKEGKPLSALQMGFVMGNHHDAWSEDSAWEIGSGTFNTPMQGHFAAPGDDQNTGTNWVFKKENGVVDPAEQLKLQPGEKYGHRIRGALAFNGFMSRETMDAPRFGARNVAAYRVAQKLGWPVIAETEFAVRTVPFTKAEQEEYAETNRMKPELVPRQKHAFGIMMKKAQAVDRQRYSDSGLDSKLRRSLVQLQLIDHIIGQADRHQNNYIITETGVVGIDNDMCFPDKVKNAAQLLYGRSNEMRGTGLHGVALPRVIDTEMRVQILALTSEGLSEALRGLLTPAEIGAAVERLEVVRNWVTPGNSELTEIQADADAWGAPEVGDLLSQRASAVVRVSRPIARPGAKPTVLTQEQEVDTSYYAGMIKKGR